jgi:hypothetical protein
VDYNFEVMGRLLLRRMGLINLGIGFVGTVIAMTGSVRSNYDASWAKWGWISWGFIVLGLALYCGGLSKRPK